LGRDYFWYSKYHHQLFLGVSETGGIPELKWIIMMFHIKLAIVWGTVYTSFWAKAMMGADLDFEPH